VSGSGTITSLQVSLDITHTWRGDLAVQLVSPSGTTAIVHNRSGGSADDLTISGMALAAFTGETASGAWRLRVQDLARQDLGTLDSWSITIVANCGGGGGGGGGWSASATPNVATVDNGQVCDTVTVTGAGNAADVQLDLDGVHDWRSILRATLEHNGTTVEAFGTGTFPRRGGSFNLTDHAVSGFSGSATGTWTLCLIDTDGYGDTGTLASWSVHD
jgi:subtilisin-like proprotein convertase family protein